MARFQDHPDADAFRPIVSSYTGPALGVARQFLSDRSLAEDAVQETFLRVIRRRGQYKRSKRFSSWFYAILRNVCIDMLRKQSHDKRATQEIAHRATAPLQSTQSNDATELLEALPAEQREVIKLRIMEGMPFRDIGAALGISEEAAKKRAQRGLRRLRERIRDSKKAGSWRTSYSRVNRTA